MVIVSEVNQMGWHQGEQAGKGYWRPRTAFPVTATAGVSCFPFTLSLLQMSFLTNLLTLRLSEHFLTFPHFPLGEGFSGKTLRAQMHREGDPNLLEPPVSLIY